ncbi:MAG: hypothetical protein IJX63_08140 [Lachnospiraceae bacterium]|nr:hypothetical protein [Lachnospiraceae bacterium]
MGNEYNEQILEKLHKELFLARIFSIISSMLMVCLMVCGISLFYKYQESKKQVESYAEQVKEYVEALSTQEGELSKLDMLALNQALKNLNTVIETVDWEMLNHSISSVDWKMLNDSIAGVDWKMLSDNIASVDWEMMNDSIAGVDWKELSDNINRVDWAKVSEQLAALDVDAINEAVEKLDTEELTLALANMNSAVEKLRGIAEALSTFGAKLGF